MTNAEMTDLASTNRLRPVSHRADEVANAAAVTGIWLLLPLVVGAVSFMLLGLIVLGVSDDLEPGVPFAAWLVVTLALQTLYWVWMATVAGRNPLEGLWALIPVVALVPTFSIARAVALRSAAGPAPAPSPQEGDAWAPTP
jgi:hypothetical protein